MSRARRSGETSVPGAGEGEEPPDHSRDSGLEEVVAKRDDDGAWWGGGVDEAAAAEKRERVSGG